MPGGGTPALEPISMPALLCGDSPASMACPCEQESPATANARNEDLPLGFICASLVVFKRHLCLSIRGRRQDRQYRQYQAGDYRDVYWFGLKLPLLRRRPTYCLGCSISWQHVAVLLQVAVGANGCLKSVQQPI